MTLSSRELPGRCTILCPMWKMKSMPHKYTQMIQKLLVSHLFPYSSTSYSPCFLHKRSIFSTIC
jgi:hypothetical protein